LVCHSWDVKGNYLGNVSTNLQGTSYNWPLRPTEGDAFYAFDFIVNDADESTISVEIYYDYADNDEVVKTING